MATLKLDMTVPLGDTGQARLTIDIEDLATLDDTDRAFLADIRAAFFTYAGRALAPLNTPPAATIHDPSARVLDGITGTRKNTS